MENFNKMQQAKKILERTAGNKMTISERRDLAIELASLLLNASHERLSFSEKSRQKELSRMMEDPFGKVFTMNMTDQCFRTNNSYLIADQINFLIDRYGIPKYLSWFKQMQLAAFKILGKFFAPIFVPLVKRTLHQECSRFILPGENITLLNSIEKKQKQGVRINLNHLGEAILGEEEAKRRLEVYLSDLQEPEIEYISVKVSTLYSQINLLAWNYTLSILSERIKTLLRAANKNLFTRPDGQTMSKFINLDMEEYKDLHLTVEVFKEVLSDQEFFNTKMGIVLQSYLPDSYPLQQDLTNWAIDRVKKGGAPIKIRIVKGANLAMEKVDAAQHEWPQAPYLTKDQVDANFKRMMNYGFRKNNATAVHIGIGSHNLFDICYGLILRAENGVESNVSFEMLDGMAISMRQVVQEISGSMLLYCPAATKQEFQNAVAYLFRRLDENTGEENFLRDLFDLQVGSKKWEKQVEMFKLSCEKIASVPDYPRRFQNRFNLQEKSICQLFENEADTDFSLHQNALWADAIISEWSRKKDVLIPCVIAGVNYYPDGVKQAKGTNPNAPDKNLYTYTLATSDLIEKALVCAENAQLEWSKSTFELRSDLLKNVAHVLRNNRRDLIGVMCADTGKVIVEADVEITEAIDFAEYYSRNLTEIEHLKDISFKPKGITLVAPPWNFPCSIPVGGILAAIAAGNCVLFKPAPEAVYVGWVLVQLLWQAGISKNVLQFINCEDEPFGSQLIKDTRIAIVVLTGSTDTAKLFLKIRPDIYLIAETGGKNAIIVTRLSDRDQAVKDIVQSAFGHAGQKCSACSLVICLPEVYEDLNFRKQLKDATSSWILGSSMDLKTRLNPMIKPPSGALLKAMTSLEPGEEWLLEPKLDKKNSFLTSPGIKIGVKENSYMHLEELFGPVLSIMQADDLKSAIDVVNRTRYGLTSGLQSLDIREQNEWMDKIEAGNCYINRGITGAIVQRQPFGGWKESCYSPGAKAGGPNYLMQLMNIEQIDFPEEIEKTDISLEKIDFYVSDENKKLWHSSVGSYAFYWKNYFRHSKDVSEVLGEDNIFRYLPRKDVQIRVCDEDSEFDILRAIVAAKIVNSHVIISSEKPLRFILDEILIETEQAFIERIKISPSKRVRFFQKPNYELQKKLAEYGVYMILAEVIANGRIELLHYLKEQSISNAYHRYGNLGEREVIVD